MAKTEIRFLRVAPTEAEKKGRRKRRALQVKSTALAVVAFTELFLISTRNHEHPSDNQKTVGEVVNFIIDPRTDIPLIEPPVKRRDLKRLFPE